MLEGTLVLSQQSHDLYLKGWHTSWIFSGLLLGPSSSGPARAINPNSISGNDLIMFNSGYYCLNKEP